MFQHIGDRNLNKTGEPETIMKTNMTLCIIYEQKSIPIYKSEKRKCMNSISNAKDLNFPKKCVQMLRKNYENKSFIAEHVEYLRIFSSDTFIE